jgi:chemotaxis protein MotB
MRSKIVIVKKKKAAHGGHHGGSWKVAYADFVTAMMAFFMVMWIMGMEQGVKDMVQGYFQNPVGFKRSFSGGRNILSQGNSLQNLQLQDVIILRRREEEQRLQQAAQAIQTRLEDLGLLDSLEAVVEVVVTDEGLRIELMETGAGDTFFDRASATLKPALRDVLSLIALQIAGLPNGVVIEGHTDRMPFGRTNYSNWELSVDRANGARRVLVEAGMPADHVVEVRGYADRELKLADAPYDPRNRRISLLLPFDTQDPAQLQAGAAPASPLGVEFRAVTSSSSR